MGRMLSVGMIALAWCAQAWAQVAGQPANQPAGDPAPQAAALWSQVAAMPADVQAGRAFIRPAIGQKVALAEGLMHQTLWTAPLEATPGSTQGGIVLWLPKPDGTFESFRVVEAPIFEPGLAAQFPNLKTFLGRGIEDPTASARMDWTDHGFRCQVLSINGAYYIDPYTFSNTTFYTSYYKRDYVRATDWHCDAIDAPVPTQPGDFDSRVLTTLRTYRLALATTVEYTAFFGGTVSAGMSAVTTSINRVTGVYETEVGVRLTLVANNNLIIYTTTDPYTNGSGSTMLGQNQTNLTTVIGSANYDIGHVFSTGGGGIAGLGVVCNASNKARGVTGSTAPTGDPYDIDYVAHEMGHQFNGPHTFAGTLGSCAGNGTASAAYEPGSGSSIMAYAGICGADDLQPHSDPYFLHASIDTIKTFIAGTATCSVNTTSTNNAPTATGTGTNSIPLGTAFYLTGSGTDSDAGQTLTYEWEQHDAGNLRTLATGDPGTGPIFRPRVPTTSPTQYFPQYGDILDGTLDAGDIYPTAARTLNFRLTVRDSNIGGATNTTTNRTVTTVAGTGPFQVTAPNTAVSWTGGTSQTVTWNVAGTTAAPISTANVSIMLSTDGGTTWGTTILASTPNDGSEVITVPSSATTQARIKVEAVGNIYFDVSNVNFTITGGVGPPSPPTGLFASVNPVCAGNSTALNGTTGTGLTIDWYTGSCGGTLVGSGTGLSVTPAATTTYFARMRRISDGQVSTSCNSLTVTVNPVPTAPASASVDRPSFCDNDAGNISLSATGGSGTTLAWYSTSCGTTLVGTGNPLVIASPAASTTYFARWESTCGASTCASVSVTTTPSPSAATSAGVDRPTFCASDSGTITLSATGGSGSIFTWYDSACGGTSVGSGTSLVIPSPTASTTYFGRWESVCGASACVSVGVTVTPDAVAPTGASSDRDNFCADDAGTITLSATGGSGTTLAWYEGSCGGTSIGSGTSLVIASPTATTTYFARYEGSCGVTTCASVLVTVLPAGATNPTSASVDRTSFCSTDAGSITLTATGGSGTTLAWYAGSCGGTSVGTGSPLTIDSPTATTTYFARWESACGSSACVSVDVSVGSGNIDFNNDGLFPDSADIDDFLSVFSGGPCSTGTCNTIDFNGDDLFPDSADIDTFLLVFSGGSC